MQIEIHVLNLLPAFGYLFLNVRYPQHLTTTKKIHTYLKSLLPSHMFGFKVFIILLKSKALLTFMLFLYPEELSTIFENFRKCPFPFQSIPSPPFLSLQSQSYPEISTGDGWERARPRTGKIVLTASVFVDNRMPVF